VLTQHASSALSSLRLHKTVPGWVAALDLIRAAIEGRRAHRALIRCGISAQVGAWRIREVVDIPDSLRFGCSEVWRATESRPRLCHSQQLRWVPYVSRNRAEP
jgi:hypothetical protein